MNFIPVIVGSASEGLTIFYSLFRQLPDNAVSEELLTHGVEPDTGPG